jgi:glycerate dehydrogenase
MKIVVLDGYTLNPGDLRWDGLNRLGDLTVYDRTPKAQIVERSLAAKIVLTNKTPLTAVTLGQLPDLKYIGVLATGYNVVDVKAAAERGIVVTNVPTYGTSSVAQMTFALLLELCHHVQVHSDAVRRGDWSLGKDFCFWNYPLVELAGKTMGIIGFGRIGRAVARIAASMGMRILAADQIRDDVLDLDDFEWADIPELLSRADVVSLHCPLFPATEGLIHFETIELMKPSAFLINTSRGGLVVDRDLAQALNNNRIAGAGLDVLTIEPPAPDNPLLAAKNCIVTPHIAWATREARERLMGIAVENVRAFLADRPVNRVGS